MNSARIDVIVCPCAKDRYRTAVASSSRKKRQSAIHSVERAFDRY
jgi:hypothetical protein